MIFIGPVMESSFRNK